MKCPQHASVRGAQRGGGDGVFTACENPAATPDPVKRFHPHYASHSTRAAGPRLFTGCEKMPQTYAEIDPQAFHTL